MKYYWYIALILLITACTAQTDETTTDMKEAAPYAEAHRLQLHFSPPANWMNAPNGMVYHEGEYHLFYQYYPDSTIWGPMHWGHAVSRDLVHWEHLPVALYPDSLGYIFSGSAVADGGNTSGFGTGEDPALVAIYTYHDPEGADAGRTDYQTQGLAYSTDDGRTWTKYEGNPVLPNPGIADFRDPKVIWHEEGQQWIMALAVKDHIRFYSSPDLKAWTEESSFGKDLGAHGGVWECPDLFLLDGRWVLLVSINPGGPNGGSATQYFIGDFDGSTFTPQDDRTRWIDYGRDNYAGVTWSNVPDRDGRRIFMSWMSNWDYGQEVPTHPWRSAMTLPRKLGVLPTPDGDILTSVPVSELAALRQQAVSVTVEKNGLLKDAKDSLYNLELEISNGGNEMPDFALHLTNSLEDTLKIGFDAEAEAFYIDRDGAGKTAFSEKFTGRQTAPFSPGRKMINMSLIIDNGSVEVFLNGGEVVMTSLFFTEEPLHTVQFESDPAGRILAYGRWFPLKGIWTDAQVAEEEAQP
ncbi:MAG: glycoside hydrolase family 32 protein [Cyclobacteriaceae bacterium]